MALGQGPESEPSDQTEEGLPPEIRDFYGRRERTPLWEMVSEGEPRQIIPAVRMKLSWMERMTVFDKRTPNTYPALLMAQEIVEREEAVRFLYPTGLAKWPGELEKAGYSKDSEKQKELAEALDNAHQEMQARLALLEKIHEQLMFSADVGLYLRDYFLRYGKKFLPSHDYGIILNAKETCEGFVPFGHKVEAALNAFLEIGQGKAEVTLENKTKRLPNIFGLTANRGLLEYAINNYVAPKLKALRKDTPSLPEGLGGVSEAQKSFGHDALNQLNDFDDRAAAIVALELFRHWDFDVYYCFARKGSGESLTREIIAPRDWELMGLEVGVGTGDSAKAMHFEVRRASEWGRTKEGGVGRREHPREAGVPMTFGCYPMLTTHMLDIVTTEMPVDESIQRQIKRSVKLNEDLKVEKDEERREFVISGRDRKGRWEVRFGVKIDISVYDRCYNKNKEGNDKPIKIPIKIKEESPGIDWEKTEAETTLVQVEYPRISLKEILWDDAKPINEDTEDVWLDFAMGPQTDAYEIPYKLQGFRAYTGMYEEFMRTDFMKQFEEITQTEKLRKMSKGIDVALSMMATAYHLSPSTAQKLNNYVRCVFLGGLAASVEANTSRVSLEEASQINPLAKYKRGDTARNSLLRSAQVFGFLTVGSEGNIVREQEKLVEKIQKERRPTLPGYLRGEPWFEDWELLELEGLYPLGLGVDLEKLKEQLKKKR